MDLLKKSIILYINQVRQDNFEKLIGKGFSEAFFWRKYFKKIIFICYSSTGKFIYKKKYDNCYLIGVPFNLSTSALKSFFNIGKNYVRILILIIQLKNKTKIDLIRIENLLLSGLPIYIFNKFKKIPYVVWLGGFERKSLSIKYNNSLSTWLLSKLVIFLEKIILRNANFVFTVTDELFELTKVRKVKNKILSPNFVDITKFKEIKNKEYSSIKRNFNILYVGRFEEEKGIKVLLNAIKILSEYNEKIQFHLIGDGSLKSWIENFIKRYNLENVKLLGTFNHEEMPNIYNMADIFILPSYTEGSPASLIEAMSCGIASITTTVGICKKLINNEENGILIPPGDPYKISEAIKNLISTPALLLKVGKNGRETVLKYTKNYTKIHRYIYEKILDISKN